jgi:hypothetical protein
MKKKGNGKDNVIKFPVDNPKTLLEEAAEAFGEDTDFLVVMGKTKTGTEFFFFTPGTNYDFAMMALRAQHLALLAAAEGIEEF